MRGARYAGFYNDSWILTFAGMATSGELGIERYFTKP
jgi:hypothetical protein